MGGDLQRHSIRPSLARRLAFAVAAALLFFSALFLVDRALACRLDFGNPLSLLVDAGGGPRARCFSMAANRAGVSTRLPPREKPGVIRVFTFGGSTTYGTPFSFGGSFSRWFAYLAEQYGADRVEVLNTAAPGQPLNEVVRKAKASLAYRPEIWIVYSGNNEFLPTNEAIYPQRAARRQGAEFAALLRRRSPIFAWLDQRAAPHRTRGSQETPLPLREALPAARRNYQARLTELASLARRRGVTLVLCTVPANYADWEPLNSVSRGSTPTARLQQWAGDVDRLRPALRRSDCVTAAQILDAYRAEFAGHAQFAFLSAKYEQACGSPARAYTLFQEAVENDFDAVRALPAFNDDVRRIARENGALLVDLLDLFERQDPDRLVGFNLFVDACHPTMAGQYLAGAAIFDALVRQGSLRVNGSWTGAASSFDAVLARRPVIDWTGYVNSACFLLSTNGGYAEQAEKWALASMTGEPSSRAWATIALARAARGEDPKPPLRRALALAGGSAAKVLAEVPVPERLSNRLAGWLREIENDAK